MSNVDPEGLQEVLPIPWWEFIRPMIPRGTTVDPAVPVPVPDTSTATNPKNCPDCNQLYQQINALRNELARRESELLNNKLSLPPTGPFSIVGHQQQFRDKQRQLRRLLNQANAQGCTAYASDAWDWATPPVPAPGGGG